MKWQGSRALSVCLTGGKTVSFTTWCYLHYLSLSAACSAQKPAVVPCRFVKPVLGDSVGWTCNETPTCALDASAELTTQTDSMLSEPLFKPSDGNLQQKRKLRIFISNTFNPAKPDAEDGEGTVASWELRVEGRLLEDVSFILYFTHFNWLIKIWMAHHLN